MDICLKNVRKSWQDNTAVDDISFTARSGQFTVLLGPSGCGKSTTLRLIAGLEEHDEGSIAIDGREVSKMPPAVRNLSMVFQSYALFPHLTVSENILFGLKVRRVSKVQRELRLQKTAALLGLSNYLHRKPGQLSGGQQQRVALGRAIISEKPICLMDEPLSNLDAKLRHEMRLEIRSLQRNLGMTMVYVTHDQTEAMSMADHVILLHEGRIEQQGTPEDIYSNPISTFTARFIGTPPMNTLFIDERRRSLFDQELSTALPVPLQAEFRVIGIRPEDIEISAHTGLRAVVTGVEYLGADSVVDCESASQSISVRTQGHTALKPGDEIRLNWQPHNTHFFDKSGNRCHN